jgi:arylsulfatase A-like enzyme
LRSWSQALLDTVGLRFTSGRNAGVWYGASALVLTASLGFALQSARSDATTIASVSATAPGETAARPNILLITMDTTRRDHLGPYGYHDARTPHLDAFARQSVVFEDAVTSAPLTGPSHTTMLTGLYPADHGVEDNGVLLPPDTPTIADTLRAAGYRTAAFLSGWTLKDRAVGLAPHFDYYDDEFNCWRLVPDVLDSLAAQHFGLLAVERLTGYRFLHRERLGETTTKRALAWLSRPSDRPFFALVHYFDAHGPHMTPLPDDIHRVRAPAFDYSRSPARSSRSSAIRRGSPKPIRGYDDEIAYVDAQVGSLLEQLDAIGAAKNTVVIVTADHGESLTEHGEYFGHGEFLYETTIRVPLMIRFPDGRAAGTRPSEQVGLVDLAPTIAEIASTGTEGDYDGTSLLGILDGTDEGARTRFGSVRAGSRRSDADALLRPHGRLQAHLELRSSQRAVEPARIRRDLRLALRSERRARPDRAAAADARRAAAAAPKPSRQEAAPRAPSERRRARAAARARLRVRLELVARRLVVYDVPRMADANRNPLWVVLVAGLAIVAVAEGAYIGRMQWQNGCSRPISSARNRRFRRSPPCRRRLRPRRPRAPCPPRIAARWSPSSKEETGEQKDVWFEWAPNDREAAAYAKALQGAFEEAGWTVKKSAPSPFSLKPGVFFLMADAAPPPYVSTALGAFQAAYIQLSSGRDYRAFNERKKKEDPSWRGFEMAPDQAYVVGVGPMPKPAPAAQ